MSERSPNLPPLTALQAFEAAARHQNFMAAAAELNLSQSAVSHRVRALEHHLGYALFERLPRGLRLTENGKAYLPSIRSAFAEIMGATSSIFGIRKNARLTIRAPLSYSAIWLPEIVSKFSQDHPDIEIRMTSSVWADHLAQDETDIELRLGYGQWPGCRSELLFRDTLVPLCSPQTLSKFPKSSTADYLTTLSLIHIVGVEDQWGEFFREHGLDSFPDDQENQIFTDSSVAAAVLANRGPHICLLAERFARHFIGQGMLCLATSLTLKSKQGLYLVTQDSDKALIPETELFLTYLRKQSISE